MGVGFGLFLCFRGMVECEWRGIVYIWVFLYKGWSVGGVLFCGFCFIFGGVVEGVCECCIICVYVERRACIYKYEESGSVSLFVYLCVC